MNAKLTVCLKRTAMVVVAVVVSVGLCYRGYYAVEDSLESVLPLMMCLLFSISVMMTVLATLMGDGLFSGLRSRD